jgi:DNA polymerase III subunit gamma/tau
MATQALYRRYRPRRFSEVRGQEHVVRSLRNAVINHREGQAYLFSGPRGTGKTTSARILAKVLNCERPVDGEPCCECDSCIAVERGTSYDVFELDAASNNGVDAMRDIIDKASLGTPGRHRVYILDEVHMLSKAAEAALLKTLEEPPPHVVFVLATTDPHKVSATIRSRTQHLEFHLLPMDVLEQHIRWLAGDAGIDLDEAALQSVLRQGGGSARDTVSALELVAAGGGSALASLPIDEFVESFVERDPGRALTAVAAAMQQGRDPRTLADDIIRHLRDCFLSLMAPELVQLPSKRAAEVADQAGRLGAAATVRAMERLGEMLVEMRHAPDPRVLLDVAMVQLTNDAVATDQRALIARIERLEQQVANGAGAGGAIAPVAPAPVDPATGRAALGGRAARGPVPAAATTDAPSKPTAAPPAAVAPTTTNPPTTEDTATDTEPTPAGASAEAGPSVAPVAPTPTPTPAQTAAANAGSVAAVWSSQILPALKPLVRAIYSATRVADADDGSVRVTAPNDAHRAKCEQHRPDVETVASGLLGAPVRLVVVTGAVADDDDLDQPTTAADGAASNVVPLRRSTAAELPADHEVDTSDLVDAPPESVMTPTDRLAQAFPGSTLMDERD